MRVININIIYLLVTRIFFLVLLFCVIPCDVAWSATHTVILKVTNPNITASDTPVKGSDGGDWTQVYVEIPAKLYMDKGWLDEDLKNLRFIDVDSGNIELAHWVPPKTDLNLHINHLGLWLLVKDLEPGETETIKMEMVDGGSFFANPRASSDKSFKRTEYGPAATVFPFYGYDSWDWKWTRSGDPYGTYTKFINNCLYSEDDLWGDAKWEDDAITGNEFTITIGNLKFYQSAGSALKIYFLSQASYNKPNDLESSDGYRLYFDDYTNKSDDLHYSRYSFRIKLQEHTSGSWHTVAKTTWYPYNNSRYVLDIKVSKTQIFILINGRQYPFTSVDGGSVTNGRYNRTDSFTGGHFGYDRMTWRLCCGTDINFFVLRRFLDQEAQYEVYGNADLVIHDTSTGSFLGKDVVEITPDLQQVSRAVGGNTLEDYVFARYSLARTDQIISSYQVELRNRSTSSSETFSWNIQNSAPSEWVVYFCDSSGNNCSKNLPASTTLSPESNITYTVKFVPTLSALMNGSTAYVDVRVEGQGDGSFDSVQYTVSTFGNLGCFWKYKKREVVTWNGGNGYNNLYDYQVPITITGESALQYALPNGSDIIVTDDHNNILDFWLKNYDNSGHSLKAWVKVPRITNSGNTTLYVWWGNENYMTSRSDREATFDLYEDWEKDYAVGNRVGCDDGTTDSRGNCVGEPVDPHGWENVPTPDDPYNWWQIESINGNKMMAADVSPTHKSSDKGPFIHGGGLGWDHYEVSYTIYTGTYHQYSGVVTWGNPQYNPVYFNDAGNMWGMEYFADKFIFRPYAAGIDYVWQYQTYAKGLLGSNFPKRDRWYRAKVRVFKNKDTGESYLKVFMSNPMTSPGALPDVDSDAGYTKIADFTAPPVFSLDYGGIGFGGWDSGFAFDDIRVRKYMEDTAGNEPVVTNHEVIHNAVKPNLVLSSPQITAPIFAGRPAYVEIQATPFAWRGDLFVYYADCYINNDEGNQTGCSVFGKADAETPKGVGYYLMKRDPGENNPSTSTSFHRTIYTTDGNSTQLIPFEMGHCSTLKPLLRTNGNCTDESPPEYDETEKLIRFVRGFYVDDFPRSSSRNFDSKYGNGDGSPDPDEQWKIADVLHSNPLLIGIPNMAYGYPDYWSEYVNTHDDRPLVAYFMTNDGMLHAIRLASVNATTGYLPDTQATELWAFIPHAVLPRLKDTIDAKHEYLADGLLRAIDIKIDHDHDPSTPDQWRTVLVGVGGRENTYIFGMDVTDPENPVLLWEKDKDNVPPERIERIGTTISSPALGGIDLDSDNDPDKWVTIIGSGYDPDYLKNYDTHTAWLTVIDLSDGTILKQVRVSRKIGNVLTNMAVLRYPKTGVIQKVYFGDYYGCLWRVKGEDIGNDSSGLSDNGTLSDNETKYLLFKPEDYGDTTSPNEPRNPIIAQPRIAKGEGENEFWVYFGTGDYNEYDEHYPHQYFIGLRDLDATTYTLDSWQLINMTDSNTTNNSNKSWFIELGHNDDADLVDNVTTTQKTSNERVLKPAVVYGGFVFFTTYEPINTPCSGGISRFYAVYRTGGLEPNLFKNLPERTRSVELDTSGVPSQPMILEGESGEGTAIATGVVTSSSGGIEKIELNTGKFSTALDILLWREKR